MSEATKAFIKALKDMSIDGMDIALVINEELA